MKTRLLQSLLACVILAVVMHPGYSFEQKKDYPPTAAEDALAAACKQAAAESKMVFVESGFPECTWCRTFDRYHTNQAVHQIIGKYYVLVSIDTKNMPDGTNVFGKLAEPSAPSWVIITPEKKVLADSYAPEPIGNVGYPFKPEETEYYTAALKKATPQITDQELEILTEQIKKAAGK